MTEPEKKGDFLRDYLKRKSPILRGGERKQERKEVRVLDCGSAPLKEGSASISNLRKKGKALCSAWGEEEKTGRPPVSRLEKGSFGKKMLSLPHQKNRPRRAPLKQEGKKKGKKER